YQLTLPTCSICCIGGGRGGGRGANTSADKLSTTNVEGCYFSLSASILSFKALIMLAIQVLNYTNTTCSTPNLFISHRNAALALCAATAALTICPQTSD
ncbi:MAG: hypothetical protein ACRDCT_09155, partial [Shewanella sp.]